METMRGEQANILELRVRDDGANCLASSPKLRSGRDDEGMEIGPVSAPPPSKKSASKNEMCRIVRDGFSPSFTAVRPIFGG